MTDQYRSQSLNFLLSAPLQKKFADPWSKAWGIGSAMCLSSFSRLDGAFHVALTGFREREEASMTLQASVWNWYSVASVMFHWPRQVTRSAEVQQREKKDSLFF